MVCVVFHICFSFYTHLRRTCSCSTAKCRRTLAARNTVGLSAFCFPSCCRFLCACFQSQSANDSANSDIHLEVIVLSLLYFQPSRPLVAGKQLLQGS